MNVSITQGGILSRDPSAAALWEKLRVFSFDRNAGPNTFAARLAKEQGWSAAFADRAIEEYRRFLLLFALARRRQKESLTPPENLSALQAVPSAVVDKVWHLHLLYTQNYWEGLCRDVLGEPLHHQPTNGTPGEPAALDEIYRANVEAYHTTFGELPPADIWPTPKGMPMPGMPLAEVLEKTAPPSELANRILMLTVGVVVLVVVGATFANVNVGGLNGGLMGALIMTGGLVFAVCVCVGLFVLLVRRYEKPRRRSSGETAGSEIFFCGGSSGDSSGYDSHSHGSHGGHSDSGGGHSCGGHSCGGHGCGGH